MRRGLQAGDDFHALLHGDRVHEVRAHHTTGAGEVGGVGSGGAGQTRDGDGGGVGGEDGMRGADTGEFGEDGLLQFEDLGNGFDHHVDVAQVVEVGGGGQARARVVGVRLGELGFGHVFGEELVWCGGQQRPSMVEIIDVVVVLISVQEEKEYLQMPDPYPKTSASYR